MGPPSFLSQHSFWSGRSWAWDRLAALQYVVDMASKRNIAYTSFAKRTDPVSFQMQVAEAAMKIETAHLRAYKVADDLDAFAARRAYPAAKVRERMRAGIAQVATAVPEAINQLVSAHDAGTAGAREHRDASRMSVRQAKLCQLALLLAAAQRS